MTRSWRSVLAASLFCSMSASAHAAVPDKPGTTQRVLKAYRKSYAGLPKRYVGVRDKVNAIARAQDAAAYDARDFREGALVEKMANAESREQLVAAYRSELEAGALVEADRALWKPGKLLRAMGAKERVAILSEDQKQQIERKIASYETRLGEAEKQVRELDEAIAAMPRYLTRGIEVGAPYGRSDLKTAKGRAALLAKIKESAAKLPTTYYAGLARIEELLQVRITQQIKHDRAAELARYQNAPTAELHAEAMQLIDDVRNAVNEELPRSETVRASGTGDSLTVTTGESRGQLNLGHDRYGSAIAIKSPFSRKTSESSSTHNSWSAVGEQLTTGSDYVLRLASAKVPQYADNFFKYGTNAAPQVKTLLPVEARMILEKVVRISEIRLALAKRDPALAASIAPWVTGSRFVILEPEQERDTSYYSRQPMAPVKALRWTRGGVVLGSRIKADLAELGGESFIDKGRAAMFTEELESRLTSDLR